MRNQWFITCSLVWIFNLYLYYPVNSPSNLNEWIDYIGGNLLLGIIFGTLGVIICEGIKAFINSMFK